MVGLEFGNMLRPKELLAADHAVPAQVPRVRYEVITKKVRNGDDPPVADAGPNQINVPAGLITLNGSASYSPDGNPITYQWVEVVGPPVTLSASDQRHHDASPRSPARPTPFSLTVKDNYGWSGSAYVERLHQGRAGSGHRVLHGDTRRRSPAAKSTTLSWSVTNATSVTISGVNGALGLTGSVPVSPTGTTTYTLTATNASARPPRW